MVDFNMKFSPADRLSGADTLFREGAHIVQIMGVTEGETKSLEKSVKISMCAVVGGELSYVDEISDTFYPTHSTSPDSQRFAKQKMAQIAYACGLGETLRSSKEIIGKQIMIVVYHKIESWNGKDTTKNQIKSYKPAPSDVSGFNKSPAAPMDYSNTGMQPPQSSAKPAAAVDDMDDSIPF